MAAGRTAWDVPPVETCVIALLYGIAALIELLWAAASNSYVEFSGIQGL